METTETTEKERADILWTKSQSISQLVHSGYTPESARSAVTKNNLSLLRVKKENGKNAN